MYDFEPRLLIPDKGNPYYNKKSKGGYNPCVIGNKPRGAAYRTGEPGLNVLPNCTGYATGRFAEIIGEPRCEYLGNANAYAYISLAKGQGLKILDHPTLGAVMCWSGGMNTGLGHVAVIELSHADGSVTTSESEWNGQAFTRFKRSLGSDGNWRAGCYWMDKTYRFQGFIMNPAAGDITMTQDEFNKHMTVWLDAQKQLPASDYAKTALEWAKELGIMLGDATGNQMPQGLMTRQDFCVMLMRYDGRN